ESGLLDTDLGVDGRHRVVEFGVGRLQRIDLRRQLGLAGPGRVALAASGRRTLGTDRAGHAEHQQRDQRGDGYPGKFSHEAATDWERCPVPKSRRTVLARPRTVQTCPETSSDAPEPE